MVGQRGNQRMNSKIRVIFHGEADQGRGTGHLVRSLGLAVDLIKFAPSNWLIDSFVNDLSLAQQISADWASFATAFPKLHSIKSLDGFNWSDEQGSVFVQSVAAIPRICDIEYLISDSKYKISSLDLEKLRSRFGGIIFIDNVSMIHSAVTAVIFPNDYTHFETDSTRIESGENWLWLNPSLNHVKIEETKQYDFAVFMGGSDPQNMTLQAVKDVEGISPSAKVLVVLGPHYKFEKQLREYVSKLQGLSVSVVKSEKIFLEQICKADTTLVAFGLSSIELEFLGHGSVLYTHNEQHRADAKRYLEKEKRSSVLREDWLGAARPLRTLRRNRPEVGKTLFRFLSKVGIE